MEGKKHWKLLTDSQYFGCYCFDDSGKDIILTIDKVTKETVKDDKGKDGECMIIYWVEKDQKSMICNKTNAKMITQVVGSPFIEDWHGRKVQLYPDRNVRMGRDIVEGVRVRPTAPKSETVSLVCKDCGATVEGFENFTAEQIAKGAIKKYGKELCVACLEKRKTANMTEVE